MRADPGWVDFNGEDRPRQRRIGDLGCRGGSSGSSAKPRSQFLVLLGQTSVVATAESLKCEMQSERLVKRK
jgi:hypothetical protein